MLALVISVFHKDLLQKTCFRIHPLKKNNSIWIKLEILKRISDDLFSVEVVTEVDLEFEL